MKKLSRLLCLLLMLSMLLPTTLAETVVIADELPEGSRIGDIFDLYQVGSMAVVNDKLYTITYGPTICEYDGENWRIAVPTQSFGDLMLEYETDEATYGFYYSDADALLTATEDGTALEVLLPYSNGSLLRMRADLSTGEVTRLGRFDLPILSSVPDAEASQLSVADIYVSFESLYATSDKAYVLVYTSLSSVYGLNTLYELNYADGSVRRVTEDYLSAIVPLDSENLLGYYSRRYVDEQEPMVALVEVDRQTGLTQTLCELDPELTYSRFALTKDALIFNDGSRVLRVTAPYDTLETIAYLPPSYVYNNMPGQLFGNTYYTYNYSTGLTTVDITAPLPATVLRVDEDVSWGTTGDLIRQYAKEHPEVGIVYASTSAMSAPEYTQHMQSDDALDIYSFNLPNVAFNSLRDKGYIADLSASGDLMQVMQEMFPVVTDKLLLDGHLYGVPVSLSASTWAINTSVLEAVGLSAEDVPTTYLELLTLIDDWISSYEEDYPEFQLMDYPYSLDYQLFSYLPYAQINACEAEGRMLTFTDDDFIACLKKLEEMRPRLQEYEDRWSEEQSTTTDAVYFIGGSYGTSSSSYERKTSLFNDYYSLDIAASYSYGDDDSNILPLFPSLTKGKTGYVVGTLQILSVNRASKNADAAQKLLTYVMNNRDDYDKSLYSPVYTDNIEDETYEETKQNYEAYLVQLQEEMAKADESDKRDFEETIEFFQQKIENLSPWLYTTESILAYHSQMEHFRVMDATAFSGDNTEISTLLLRFLDGNMDTDQFVRELTRIVQMIMMENS